ncbi:TPA: phosphotransferase, partial [Pseudomonas aeruginosa]
MHDAATSMPPQAPATWADYLAGYRWRGQGEGCSAATVHRLEAARRPTLFVKQEVLSAHAELPAEIARLRWLHGAGIDCPQVLNETQSDGRQWLLMSAVPGDTLSALRRLHDLDPAACPFDHRLERRLDTVRQRVEAGLVDEADFDDDHRGRSATELYRLLRESGFDALVP